MSVKVIKGGQTIKARPDPAKQSVIDRWKTKDSRDWAYFDSVEGKADGFWNDHSLYRKRFDRLDLTAVAEIACGKGRHSQKIADKCGHLTIIDTSVDAIEFCKQRFAENPNVTVVLSEDGESLPFLENDSLTSIFSYDALVHFEPLTVAAYLKESGRVLKSGGMALFHHSNYSAAPTNQFSSNPGWRNYMTTDLFAHFASRAGLDIIDQLIIDWAAGVKGSDALTLMVKK
jgi:ubiquinone/menaquinone biosynthesis C-methylase UbiE